MCTETIETIASAIRAHLEANPRAADSIAGIMRWWWQRNRYDHERSRVVAALSRLVDEGIVGVRQASDGEALYFLSAARKEH